ncbi:protein kinase [Leptolyngbya sp. PL-A3]|uniref:methylation-associated defense system protein kinase MAD6 n=1 Tax=Leptolyngbya sp. PL-A3 TaxID=2933911 RepID=UPI003298208E
MPARIVPIGQPVNDSERKAIAYLRDHLPSTFTVLHNFEITQGAEVFEIDLAILAPHCVFVVDVKGIKGQLDIYGNKWYPDGRQPYLSPLAKLRQHAKVVKALIQSAHPTRSDLRSIHVHAAVLMTHPTTHVNDYSGRDQDDITYLNNKCVTYFKDKSHIPGSRSDNIQSLLGLVENAIRGKAKALTAPPCYGNWQIEDRLGGGDRFTDYRAKNIFTGKGGGTTLLRIYQVDPYQETAARQAERLRISNAYRAVAKMPSHQNILAVKDFFETEEGDRSILVTEDVPGQVLRQHIKKASLALTFDQKLGILRDVLVALDHAHKYEVIHRNLTPDAILVSPDGRARLTAFDYARVGKHRTSTVAGMIVDDLDPLYLAPECDKDPKQASIASDLFSAGLVFFELLTGELAFENLDQVMEFDAIFPIKPSEHKPDLPQGFDDWLQKFCAIDPEDRFPSAAVALHELSQIITSAVPTPAQVAAEAETPVLDLKNLPKEHELDGRFRVQAYLGQGRFGVAYQVFDFYANCDQVIKLILYDKISAHERLRREYATLRKLPPHPNVVPVTGAGKLPDDTPYIVFDFLRGQNIEERLDKETIPLEDAMTIVRQTALGLAHIHNEKVYHQDIKPSNLLWTNEGVRIIDFNVAESDLEDELGIGGTRRYFPPDLNFSFELTETDKIDRDLYALGITFYQCVTGQYPFQELEPPKRKQALDPRQFEGCEDLSIELVDLMQKMIAPARADRFSSAEALLRALNEIKTLRLPKTPIQAVSADSLLPLPDGILSDKPNFNPFVSHLLTVYSQSQKTNAGTRGLDAIGEALYIPTLLDVQLMSAVLSGEFRLVIISGNAGDGKTAFIQQLEKHAERQSAQIDRGQNGATFQLNGRNFVTNYDGSQDEGDRVNDAVLSDFFSPFQGNETTWATDQTRLIAINEGRLIDFLTDHETQFSRLMSIVRGGLQGGDPVNGVAVVNLNLRSVVADPFCGSGTASGAIDAIVTNPPFTDASIFGRLARRMTEERFWQACQSCDLKQECYIHHNARTLMDATAGPKVIERLKQLYTLTHLRGRLHITLRDLRSALAFMLVGTLDCDSVHELYRAGTPDAIQKILDGFYFNSWLGGTEGSTDRLVSLLRQVDVGETGSPELDRSFAFLQPNDREMARFAFPERGHYDDDLLQRVFDQLPRDYSEGNSSQRVESYRQYVAMLRRRHYFERRDSDWRQMLPYLSADRFQELIIGTKDLATEVPSLLTAINRGEGLKNPTRLGDQLALRVRQVEKATVRSYRLFPASAFSLLRSIINSRFIEYLPQTLILQYSSGTGQQANLVLNLDVYEMLTRLKNGYRPSREEQQGLYQSLVMFKNVLSSAPYQEVLLTENEFEFYRIKRETDGKLLMEQIQSSSGASSNSPPTPSDLSSTGGDQ